METDIEQHREVVLGNKQLLSMFFVGAVLLGIAFTIGYVMGKNTAVKIGDGNPALQSTTRARAVQPAPVPEEQPAPVSEEQPAGAQVPATSPARDQARPVKAATALHTESPAPAAGEESKAGPVSPSTVSSGSYLQVAALKREDADHIVNMLRKRGFAALLGESPKEGLFRVLVGPFQTMADLSESKQKLKAAGMESIVAR